MTDSESDKATVVLLSEENANNLNHDMSSEKYRRVLELDDAADGGSGGGGVVTMVPDGGVFEPGDSMVPSMGTTSARGNGAGLGVQFGRGKRQWRSRTLMERGLLVLCILLFLVMIILIAVLANRDKQQIIMRQNYTYVLDSDVCLNETYVKASARILEYLDPSIDPCQDFYQYACGGWIRTRSIPIGIPNYSVFGEVAQKNELVMRMALEEPLNKSKSLAERRAKEYYQSCLNLTRINSRGSKPLLQLLSKYGQNWPLLPAASVDNRFNFDTMLNQHVVISDNNNLPFFQFVVTEDEKNATVNILQIDEVNLGLNSRDYYLNDSIAENKKITDAYKLLMKGIGELLGFPVGNDWYNAVYQLETELANATSKTEERRDTDKNYNKMTINELSTMCRPIKWLDFFRHQFALVNITISGDDHIIVRSKNYLHKMCPILITYQASSEKKKILHNYMMWRIVKKYVDQISEPFRRLVLEFEEIFKGVKGQQEEWKTCVELTQAYFDMPVGAMYVRNVFKGNSKAMAHSMIAEIKEAFKANFRHVEWMDEETRLLAVRKVDTIEDMIGFPEYILNSTALDEKFKAFTVEQTEFFETNIYLTEQFWLKCLRRLNEVVISRWEMSPQTINAYYQQTKNLIAFPAGILQSPFYNQGYPKSLNYGAVGAVVGHEITHGFDDQGRKYDGYGNLRQWWNNRTIEAFVERSQCIVDQYSNYSLYGHKIRGKQTLGENIADNGGVKAAYMAFKNNQKKFGVQPLLPALKMNHDQLFFLAFGQVWCGKTRSQSMALLIKSDTHTPDQLRVRGTLSNSKEFSEAFNCPLGSPMNPVKKCKVW